LKEADGFVEVGHKMSYFSFHIKTCFSKNLHVIWPGAGEQIKVGPFFLKHPLTKFLCWFKQTRFNFSRK